MTGGQLRMAYLEILYCAVGAFASVAPGVGVHLPHFFRGTIKNKQKWRLRRHFCLFLI
jgi:hypothetical protein